MLKNYWTFALANPRFLSFGFFMSFMSSAGQTFFIGVFSDGIRNDFGLDSGAWGRIYMVGTLISALVINWSGALIDRFDLRWVSATTLLGLAAGCLCISLVNTPAALIVAVFLLRQFGQGLSNQISSTSMARYLGHDRGKALALAAMGFTVGEASLPLVMTGVISVWGWRNGYYATGIVVMACIVPLLWLLKGHRSRHQQLTHKPAATDNTSYTRWQMLREPRFYLFLPAVASSPLIVTVLFFFPSQLAGAVGLSPLQLTASYWIYSLTAILTSICAGPLIDRHSAHRLMSLLLIPMTLSLLLLAAFPQPLIVFPFYLLLGSSSGMFYTVLNAFWAEVYGTRYLGAIKSTGHAIAIFASALGPALAGYWLSAGVPFNHIAAYFASGCILAMMLLSIALHAGPEDR